MTSKLHIRDNGSLVWKNEKGELHRVGGPAVILADVTKKYHINGKLHRVGGPAVIYSDGCKAYWVAGKRVG